MNSVQRLWHSFRILTQKNAFKRADYIRRKKLFAQMGEKVVYQNKILPYRSDLISIGDNVTIASNVLFITHDAIHRILNNKYETKSFKENCTPIQIDNHVFVGSNVTLCGPVHIHSNCIIAAGSVVTKDVPENSVVAGVPARVIGSFEDFVEKRKLLQ